MTGEAIRLDNAVWTAPDGRRVLDDVNLAINSRVHVQITDAAGGGNMALMRLIAGMDAPGGGQVFVMGKPVHDMDETQASAFRNATLGICLRQPALMARLTVWENVALPLATRGSDMDRRRTAALESLDAMGIRYCAHALPGSLSPYEARLVSVARALAARPPILLLQDIATDLPEQQAEQLEGLLGAMEQYATPTVLVFTGSASGLPVTRRLMLEHGIIREES